MISTQPRELHRILTGVKRGILLLFLLLAAGLIHAQPACVSANCCCGDPVEVGVPCGDFEAPPYANPIIVYFPGEMFCDWTVYSGSIDVLGPNYSNWASGNPNGATQFIDLHGNTPGSFGTTLTGMVPGYSYTLVFWYAKNAGAPTANCQVEIANGAWLDETFTATNNGADGWLEKCMTFTAQAATANLRFTGSSPVTAGGVLLDDITLWGCPLDEEPPTIGFTPPSPLILECDQPIPPPDDLQVTDNCSAQVMMTFDEQSQNQACFYTIERSWVFADECGNTSTAEQVIDVVDTQAPLFDIEPGNFISECGDDFLLQFYEWIQSNGGGYVVDNCDMDVEWTADYLQEPSGLCGSTPVTFSVTDDCGNTNSILVEFLIQDLDPPVLLTPAEDVTVFCSPDPMGDLDAWLLLLGGATAEDACDPLTWSHDFDGDYSPAIIPVTFTATDGCGNAVATTAIFVQVTSSDTLFTSGLTCDPLLVGADTVSVTQEGCETVTITTIQLAPSDTLYLSASTCDPQLVGSDTLFYNNQFGCDSLRITQTSLLPSDQTQLQVTTCDPGQVGQDSLPLQNQYGCDSLVITQTVLLPSNTQTLQLYTCDPQAAGLDTLYLTNQYGCDSTVFITTTYTGTYQATATVLICGQGVDYLDTLVVTSGPCDSLFITQYQYIPLDTTWLTGSTCQVSQAGTFVLVLPDQFGCDSTIITVVALQPSDTTLVEGVTCNKADEFYDAQTLTNQWGCDSVVWTAIIYIGVDTQYLQQTTCDPALAGIQTVVIPGPFCDTVRVIETTLVQEVVTTLVNVVCGPPGLPADTLYFSGTNGCDSLVIIQYDYQEVDAEAEVQDETCQGWQDGQISVSGITGGLPPYTFQLNSGAWQNTTLFSGLSPGAYQVIVADQQGCRDTLAGLSIGTGPTLVMDAGADLLVDIGALVDLSVQVSDPLAQVTWTAIDPIDCPSCVQTVIGPITSDQTVVVSGISQEGCPGSDQILLQTRVRNRVYVPNSFSPNVDGINDLFSVYALDDQLVVRNLSIFDRWGNALYQGVDLKVNDPAQGWDGTSRGKPLDPGVYVYVIELEDASGQRLILKGEVHLLR